MRLASRFCVFDAKQSRRRASRRDGLGPPKIPVDVERLIQLYKQGFQPGYSRVVDVSHDTVLRRLKEAGSRCARACPKKINGRSRYLHLH